MELHEARRILGVSTDADPDTVRRAYRRRLHQVHPDVSGRSDATELTLELTAAYTVLLRSPGPAGDPSGASAPAARPEPRSPASPPPAQPVDPIEPVVVSLVDDDTIGVGAPAAETLMLLVEAAHRLGDISYLDPSAGLVEVIVEFVEAPTSSVLLSLQGRATGITDVFCTVEPLSGGEAPPADAVTRLLLDTLLDLHPA